MAAGATGYSYKYNLELTECRRRGSISTRLCDRDGDWREAQLRRQTGTKMRELPEKPVEAPVDDRRGEREPWVTPRIFVSEMRHGAQHFVSLVVSEITHSTTDS